MCIALKGISNHALFWMGIWQAMFSVLISMFAGCACYTTPYHEKKVENLTGFPEVDILAPKTNYRTITRMVTTIENIIETRCLSSVLDERLPYYSAGTGDVIEHSKLSGERLQYLITRALHLIAKCPNDADYEERFLFLDIQLRNETASLYASEGIDRMDPSKTYEYIINERLRDDERQRFLLRTFKYKAKLYSILEENLSGWIKAE